MKFFTKIFQNNKDFLGFFVEFSNGKLLKLEDLIKRYEVINEKKPKEWITVRGNHIPIFEGKSKEEIEDRNKYLDSLWEKMLERKNKK